ncbi:Nuclear envelope morphology protein 1 [Ceratobasidium sp. 414]|nr:Nuclear envelope morphology protein 1 [Ceratobasidium sp. 414]
MAWTLVQRIPKRVLGQETWTRNQTMNTLGYISRQYDALASQPSTPTTESPPLLAPRLARSQDDSDILRLGRNSSPKLHRTKSLSRTRPSTPVTPDSMFTTADTNALDATEPRPESLTTPLDPEPAPVAPLRPRRKRFVLVRLLVGLWHGLCTLWSFLPAWKRVRHNFGLLALRSADDTSDEKEDGDDEIDEPDPLVARAPPSEKLPVRRISFDTAQVLTKRTSRSRFGKPPTPVVSPSELAESDQDERGPQTGTRTRAPSLSFTPPTPAGADLPLPLRSNSTPLAETATAPTSRPRASSMLLPNPLSTSLLTPSASALPSRASTPPIRRPTALHKAKTLVLDLDETLIHSTSRAMHSHGSMGGGGLLGLSGLFGGKRQGGGHMVEVVLGGRSTLYHVYKRPFVDFFLRKA